MAGYDDTRRKILETLLQRPVGTEIQPENHQDFALSLLDYIRSVELISGSTLIGVAYQDTVPVQSDDANEAYIAGVAQERTVVFQNFRDVNGDPLTVTTEEMEAKLVILIWNRQYWSKLEISANIVSQAENAYYFYNLTIRKQYASVAAMNADNVSPIGNDGRVIKRGEIVSVRNPSNSSEDAVYSYELDTEGNPSWVLQMKLSALATRMIDGGSASVKLDTIQNRRDTRANWETNNPVLAEGEMGFVLDDKNSYKVGDGVTKWNDLLLLRGYSGNIAQELGDDANAVISQKGITDVLKYLVGNDNKIEVGTTNFGVLDNIRTAGFYVLTSNNLPAYHMLVTWDNMLHCFNQWLFGNLTLTNGVVNGGHKDGVFNIICRTYSVRWTVGGGSDDVEITAQSWNKWRYLQSFFLYDKDGNIGNEEKTYGIGALDNKLTILQSKVIELVDDLENDFNDKIADLEDDYDYLLLEYQKLIVWVGKLEDMINDNYVIEDGSITEAQLSDSVKNLLLHRIDWSNLYTAKLGKYIVTNNDTPVGYVNTLSLNNSYKVQIFTTTMVYDEENATFVSGTSYSKINTYIRRYSIEYDEWDDWEDFTDRGESGGTVTVDATYKPILSGSTVITNSVGGIKSGTTLNSLSGNSFSQILEMMLVSESWNNPNYTHNISVSTPESPVKVGSTAVPPAYNATWNSNIQSDSEKEIYLSFNTNLNGTVYKKSGTYTYTITYSYPAGYYIITSNLGNTKTVTVPSVSNATITRSVIATYPWFINNTEQSLVAIGSSKTIEVELTGSPSIKVPFTNSTVTIQVDLGFGWMDVSWDESVDNSNLGNAIEETVPYKVYTKPDSYTSSVKHKITIKLSK